MATCVQKGPWLVWKFFWLTGRFYLDEWANFHICPSGLSIMGWNTMELTKHSLVVTGSVASISSLGLF